MTVKSLSTLRSAAGAVRKRTEHLLGNWGLAHSEARLADDASRYWAALPSDQWQNDSHWRTGSQFARTERWTSIGQEHVRLYDRLRRTTADTRPPGRIVDWGCGGGANAVAFAGMADELVGVDVSERSLDEARRQVEAAGGTAFIGIHVDLAEPERAVARIPRPCDLFLCLYVLELVPTPEYGLRIMRIAHDLLRPGGHAFVQIKYSTGSWSTRPRRRSYTTDIAGTTYRIDEFWTAVSGLGFRPEVVHLVPRNDFDERYAYFLLTRA